MFTTKCKNYWRYMNTNSTFLSFCGLLFHWYLAKISHSLEPAHILLSSKPGKPKLKLDTRKPLQTSIVLLLYKHIDNCCVAGTTKQYTRANISFGKLSQRKICAFYENKLLKCWKVNMNALLTAGILEADEQQALNYFIKIQ